ncbi:MAG TPA: peptidylprolyl isomerase [Stellaceae bacterium]|nr:peptidylprolyl isomerase [Stellaceae bacterium]
MLARVFSGRVRLAALSIALLAAPLAASAQSPESKQPPADPVMARVDGHDIRGSQVMALIRRLPQQTQEVPMEKLVPAMIDTLINTQLIQEAAEHANLKNDPEVKRRLALAESDIIRSVYVERLVSKDLGEDKLKAEYEQFVKTVPAREEIDARHILVKTEAEAKQIIAQLEKGADFAKLAKEKSIDPAGKDSGGDLGWFTKDQMVPEFANAAFALKKGQFTKTPVKTRFGWHIIKLVDRRAAPPPSYDEVKQQMAQRIQGELIGEKVKELRAHAKIEIIGPDGKAVPAGSATPPAPVGSSDTPPKKKK